MLRASTVVDLLDVRNLGPAVQVALALGLDASAIAPIQSVVVVAALGVAVVSALAVDDTLESLLWGAFASLIVLPVTWFHHFGMLVPFGVAALARGWDGRPASRRTMLVLTVLAFLVAGLGFARVTAWLLVPIAVALVRVSRPAAMGTLSSRGSGEPATRGLRRSRASPWSRRRAEAGPTAGGAPRRAAPRSR